MNTSTSPESDLSYAAGRFIIAFGGIEILTHMFINELCDEPTLCDIASMDWDFEKRRSFCMNIVRKRVIDTTVLERWKELLNRAGALAERRNFVAHACPTAIEAGKGKELGLHSWKTSLRNYYGKTERNGVVSVREIGDFTTEVRDVEAALANLWATKIRDSPWRNRLTFADPAAPFSIFEKD